MKTHVLLTPVVALIMTGCFQVQIQEVIDPNGSSVSTISYEADQDLSATEIDQLCARAHQDIPYDGSLIRECTGDGSHVRATIQTETGNYQVNRENNQTLTFRIHKDKNYLAQKALADLAAEDTDYLTKEDKFKAQGVSIVQEFKFPGNILYHSTGVRKNNNTLSVDHLDGNTMFPIIVNIDVNSWKFKHDGQNPRINNIVLGQNRNSVTRNVRPSFMPRAHRSGAGWHASAPE